MCLRVKPFNHLRDCHLIALTIFFCVISYIIITSFKQKYNSSPRLWCTSWHILSWSLLYSESVVTGKFHNLLMGIHTRWSSSCVMKSKKMLACAFVHITITFVLVFISLLQKLAFKVMYRYIQQSVSAHCNNLSIVYSLAVLLIVA